MGKKIITIFTLRKLLNWPYEFFQEHYQSVNFGFLYCLQGSIQAFS